MGKKIFASYKYEDDQVFRLSRTPWNEKTIVRHYVDEFQELLKDGDHINKGEKDNEDLSHLTEDAIAEKLKERIYDSTITLVFISKGMKENKPENKQWIPWEISYSLKEITRGSKTSQTNAVLAVILPDEDNKYNYYTYPNPACNSITYNTSFLFPIIRKNMFNLKIKNTKDCNENIIHYGNSSYIHNVKWVDFIRKYNSHIETAVSIYENKDDYDLFKNLEP